MRNRVCSVAPWHDANKDQLGVRALPTNCFFTAPYNGLPVVLRRTHLTLQKQTGELTQTKNSTFVILFY